MKAFILAENSALPGFAGEHGLSVYIEHRGRRLLLDGGHSEKFVQNAGRLGVDLGAVDTAVLSHGHYDHGDGLDHFLRLNPAAPLWARPDAARPQYFRVGPIKKSIGVKKSLFAEFTDRFRFCDGPSDLGDGIRLIPDSVAHEQSLVLETDGGLVVLNSCSHAGADSIARDILARFPGKKIAAYIGGFHLMGITGPASLGPSPEEVRRLADTLLGELDVGLVYTGHCTGEPGFALLREVGGERVRAIPTGTVVEV